MNVKSPRSGAMGGAMSFDDRLPTSSSSGSMRTVIFSKMHSSARAARSDGCCPSVSRCASV